MSETPQKLRHHAGNVVDTARQSNERRPQESPLLTTEGRVAAGDFSMLAYATPRLRLFGKSIGYDQPRRSGGGLR